MLRDKTNREQKVINVVKDIFKFMEMFFHGDIKPFHDRLRRGFVTSCRHGNILVMVTLL